MSGHKTYFTRPQCQGALVRAALLVVLLGGVAGCVTETTHSVYSKEVTRDNAVESHVSAAMQYLREGDHDNALRHLKSAYELDSRSATVHNGLALAFQMGGENELAEKHYKAALRGDRQLTAARNNYAVFLYGEGRFDEACGQLHKVVDDTLYAGRPEAFVNLGKCELRRGHVDDAEEALERALALNRNSAPALIELVGIKLDKRDYVDAHKYYQNFQMTKSRQSSRSLFLGIQLADYFGDEDELASYVLALKNLYPHSEEYVRYRKEFSNDTAHRTTR